ncbi:TPA: AAA family ATPase [Salmonella enterica subsp. enterica serovar Typhi str. AG3]|nr:AAA family ATPase [Salmonella enterica subsp. enterica serovar Typhi str. AG3]
MTTKLKFVKVNISELAIQSNENTLHSWLESVETHETTKGHLYVRAKLKNLAEYSYIVANDNVTMIHYCEELEKGIACKHRPIIAAIAKKLGRHPVETTNSKTKLNDFKDFETQFERVKWTDRADDFNLIPPETPEVQSTPAPAPKANVVKTGTVNRDWAIGWREVEDYLTSEGVDLALQNKILDRRKRISSNVAIQPDQLAPKKPDTPYQGPMLNRVFRHLMQGKHLILIGGKGSGKDTMINTIGWVLNIPTLIQVGNKDETKDTIVGEPGFHNNESTYDLSLFSKTVQNGGLVNFAEVNFLKGDTTSVFHSLFDENEVLSTPIGSINRHEDFIMCCSMNIGEGYMGVNRLNDAFKDRFSVLRLPQTMDFASLIRSKTGLMDTQAIEFLEKVKEHLAELFFENLAESADTIRGYIDAAKYFVDYGYTNETRIEVCEDFIINKVEDSEEYFEARAAVREAFTELHLQQFPVTEEEQAFINVTSH